MTGVEVSIEIFFQKFVKCYFRLPAMEASLQQSVSVSEKCLEKIGAGPPDGQHGQLSAPPQKQGLAFVMKKFLINYNCLVTCRCNSGILLIFFNNENV